MGFGNRQKMIEVNGNRILNECRLYCEDNKMTMTALSDELGHSVSYIQATCKAGKFPVAELKLLCHIIGIDMSDCLLNSNENDVEMTIDEKLDYIIEMLEELKE